MDNPAHFPANPPWTFIKNLIRDLTPLLVAFITLQFCVRASAEDSFTNGLVAYYPFNGNADDASGNGYNGTVNDAMLTADRFGFPNRAYLFNGVNSYIRLSNTLPDMTNLSISAWVQYTSGTYQVPGHYYGLGFIFDDSNIDAGEDFEFGVTSTNAITVATKGGYNLYNEIPLGENISNVWVHLVWTTATTRSTVYLNGGPVFATTNGGANVGLHAPPQIGASSSQTAGVGFFGGKIDDVRIYNRVFSSNEVAQLYAIESPPVLNLRKAVYIDSSNLRAGTNYQLQVSTDLNTWSNYGAPFTATNSTWRSPNYWDVDNWGSLFFRLQFSH